VFCVENPETGITSCLYLYRAEVGGRDSVLATVGWSGDRIPVEAIFSAPALGPNQGLIYSGYNVFSRCKAPGVWR